MTAGPPLYGLDPARDILGADYVSIPAAAFCDLVLTAALWQREYSDEAEWAEWVTSLPRAAQTVLYAIEEAAERHIAAELAKAERRDRARERREAKTPRHLTGEPIAHVPPMDGRGPYIITCDNYEMRHEDGRTAPATLEAIATVWEPRGWRLIRHCDCRGGEPTTLAAELIAQLRETVYAGGLLGG